MLATSAVSITTSNAVVVAVNFGDTVTGSGFNNYLLPSETLYTAGPGSLTTATSGTAGASGANYTTIQTFTDVDGNETALTLDIHRTGAKIYANADSSLFTNTLAVSDMNTVLGLDTDHINLALTGSFIRPGNSRIDAVTLNNLHNGSRPEGYRITLYVGASTTTDFGGTLNELIISGGTGGILEYAGHGQSGFVSTLAESGSAAGEMTLLKWTGTLTDAQTSLQIGLNGNKAGIGMFAYEISAIPEPSSIALMALGGFAFLRRRRK